MDQRRMCPQCRAFIGGGDRVCPYCGERVGPRTLTQRDAATLLGGFIPHARFVTSIILLVNICLFIGTLLLSRNGISFGDALNALGAKTGQGIWGQHQWWRLVTAGFLHGGWLHILMNSWVLFDLGAQVEESFGAPRLIVIYFLSTVAGFFLSSLISPGVLSIGASAGLFGLIGAMIALGVRNRTSTGRAIRGLYIRWAIYGLLFGLLPFLSIDNAAHVGGIAAGFGVGYLAIPPVRSVFSNEKLWRIAAGVCVALTAISFLEMFLNFRLLVNG